MGKLNCFSSHLPLKLTFSFEVIYSYTVKTKQKNGNNGGRGYKYVDGFTVWSGVIKDWGLF